MFASVASFESGVEGKLSFFGFCGCYWAKALNSQVHHMPLAMVSPERHGSLEAFEVQSQTLLFCRRQKDHVFFIWRYYGILFVSKIAIDRLIVEAEMVMFVNCQILECIHLVADNSGNVQNVLTG